MIIAEILFSGLVESERNKKYNWLYYRK